MVSRLFVLVSLVVVLQGSLYARPADSVRVHSDSLWVLEDLNPDELELDLNIDASWGWFPRPTGDEWLLGISMFSGDVVDDANNLRSASFAATTNGFNGGFCMPDSDERTIKKKNSRDDQTSGLFQAIEFPQTSGTGLGVSMRYSSGLPFILRGETSIRWNDGILYTEDRSREFIDFGGTLKPFKELSFAVLDETLLAASFGAELPIYGAFANIEDFKTSSFYYFYAGLSLEYAVGSTGTQYMQIANRKNELRYANGYDTLHLRSERPFATLERFRLHLDIAMGWNILSSEGGIGFEIYTTIPQTAALSDAAWKQYRWGLKMHVYFLDLR